MREVGRAKRRYRFTPALGERLQAAYASSSRRVLTEKLDALEKDTGWPRHAFVAEAERRGFGTVSLRRWSREEEATLHEGAGQISATALARRLKRSRRAVELRLQRISLSRRSSEGYGARDLAECFGVTEQRVKRWMERGLFGRLQQRGGVRVTEANVARFIRRHHGEYDMKRVDQVWFKAMVFEEETCRDAR